METLQCLPSWPEACCGYLGPSGQSLHISARSIPPVLSPWDFYICCSSWSSPGVQAAVVYEPLMCPQVHKKHLEVNDNDRKWEPEGSTCARVSLSQGTPAQGRGFLPALSGDPRTRHWRHCESHSTGFIPEDSKCSLMPGEMTSAS